MFIKGGDKGGTCSKVRMREETGRNIYRLMIINMKLKQEPAHVQQISVSCWMWGKERSLGWQAVL